MQDLNTALEVEDVEMLLARKAFVDKSFGPEDNKFREPNLDLGTLLEYIRATKNYIVSIIGIAKYETTLDALLNVLPDQIFEDTVLGLDQLSSLIILIECILEFIPSEMLYLSKESTALFSDTEKVMGAVNQTFNLSKDDLARLKEVFDYKKDYPKMIADRETGILRELYCLNAYREHLIRMLVEVEA